MAIKDLTDDSNFFWQSKYGTETGFGQEYLVDATDAYANLQKFYISFFHLPSEKTVYFKAFITAYREDFISNWHEEAVFGRTDNIVTYGNTRRKISLAFSVPAASESEAYENMGRLQRLMQFQYPAYTEQLTDDVTALVYGPQYIVGQSPLVRIKMMNLLSRTEKTTEEERTTNQGKSRSALLGDYIDGGAAEDGLLVAIQNLSIDSEIDKTSILEKAQGTVLPQAFRVTLDFIVLHDETIGFNEQGDALQEGFPWNVTLKEPSSKEKEATDASIDSRINMALSNQAAEDIAKSRYAGMFSKMRAKTDAKRAAGASEGDFDYEMGQEAESWLADKAAADAAKAAAKAAKKAAKKAK